MNLRRLSGGLSLWVLFSGSLLWGERVRLPDGTPVQVRLKSDLRADQVAPGNRVDFEVAQPVSVRGLVAIPEGSVAWGAVQSVKPEKEIKFDVQGLRLPNLQEVRLRSVPQKTKNPAKDQIKVEAMLGTAVGVRMGVRFMAYLDEDLEVEAAPGPGAPAAAAPPMAPAPAKPAEVSTTPTVAAPATTPAPATPAPTATNVTAPAEAAPQAAQPAESAPPAPVSAAQPAPATPAVAQAPQPAVAMGQQAVTTGERVTVECFSDPTGADILIDGSFYGSTPSILKLTATAHHLEISMSGYKNYVQDLNLSVDRGFLTIRAPLEKREKEQE
jgi:cytoskeletal protein RodZ